MTRALRKAGVPPMITGALKTMGKDIPDEVMRQMCGRIAIGMVNIYGGGSVEESWDIENIMGADMDAMMLKLDTVIGAIATQPALAPVDNILHLQPGIETPEVAEIVDDDLTIDDFMDEDGTVYSHTVLMGTQPDLSKPVCTICGMPFNAKVHTIDHEWTDQEIIDVEPEETEYPTDPMFDIERPNKYDEMLDNVREVEDDQPETLTF